MSDKYYISIIAALFGAIALLFTFFERPEYSELEKRELTRFPSFSLQGLFDGSFTRQVSSWYSDSEPLRDKFLQASMYVKDLQAVAFGEEQVRFHASSAEPQSTPSDSQEFGHNPLANENAKIANAGILIVGSGSTTRALMAYGGTAAGGTAYAEVANLYSRTFPECRVYCMAVPTAIEFYCPDNFRSRTKSQRATIDNIHSHLAAGVQAVDAWDALSRHTDEDIYLRTDHHWAPLGAYYAAEKFASVAGVPFPDLSHYDRHVIHGYVGSMYGYSGDIAVKKAPEDFVYYTPKTATYTTTYINYSINSNYQVTGMGKPVSGNFFVKYGDGSGMAYCTFMGGDTKITQVKTNAPKGRRVLILKDSFGNAIPGYLFYSFEEVHVVDTRYFTKNMKQYVADNKITDILFANNIFNAFNPAFCNKYAAFLNQSGAITATVEHHTNADSTAAEAAPQHEERPVEQPEPLSTDTI